MALKTDRIELPDGSRIKYFMNEVAERGIVVILDQPGGDGMDNPEASVSVPASGSGVAAGVLMNDVVDLDLTRTHINWHQDQVQLGNKVDLIVRGVIRSNMLFTGDTPVAGDPAYYTADGEFTTTSGSDQVGRFVGPPDTEGYVEVEVNVA